MRLLGSIIVFALVAVPVPAITRGAQQPSQPSQPSQASQASQPGTAEKPPVTTLTGCLRSHGADTAIAGPSGRIYTLEVLEPAPKAATTTTTTSPATPAALSKTTYSLDAAESVGLAKHVDHEVQLTGSLQAPPASATTKAAAPGQPERKPTPGGGHRTFKVSALTMISPKCR